jgi:hypothetical protein
MPCARNVITNGSRLHARGIDGRTREARRFRDLFESFAESLGGAAVLTEAERALVRNAASLTVQSEKMQAAVASGHDVDLEQMTRVSNAAVRVMRALGAKAKPRARPTVRDNIAARFPAARLPEAAR